MGLDKIDPIEAQQHFRKDSTGHFSPNADLSPGVAKSVSPHGAVRVSNPYMEEEKYPEKKKQFMYGLEEFSHARPTPPPYEPEQSKYEEPMVS